MDTPIVYKMKLRVCKKKVVLYKKKQRRFAN